MGEILYQCRKFIRDQSILLTVALAALTSISLYFATPSQRYHRFNLAIPIPAYFIKWRKNFLTLNHSIDRNGLVRGIFLGDRSSIPDGIQENYRNAGLAHLLSASGFNCWIAAVVIAMLARLVLGLCSFTLPSQLALKLRNYVTPVSKLFGAWLFWLWTNQSPPITRAAVMITTVFIFELLDLESSILRILLIQYLASLTIMPRLWQSVSFQLTFGCLFGLILFPRLVERYRPAQRRWLQTIWDYFAITFGACLGTIPTTWIAFGTINFTAVLTNWFATPVVSMAIMPLGMLEMWLVTPYSPWSHLALSCGLTHAIANLASLFAVFNNWTIHMWITHLPLLLFRRG